MSYNNYLLNLANISNEIGYSLTYGYGDIAATEINSLKALIAKSEEMIPILEAEACFNEAEELDREERYHNHMMRKLYGTEELESAFKERSNNKANRLNRRKANKKHHKADRKHGKHRELSRKEQDLVHYDVTKGVHGAGVWYRSHGKKVIPVVSKGPKTNRNYYAKKYSQSADFKENEYLEEMYTGRGDLLHENSNFEETLFNYREIIANLEYEKAFGYLGEMAIEHLEELKEEAVELEQWIKENMIQYNTAIR